MGFRDNFARLVRPRPIGRKDNPAMKAILALGPFQARWMQNDYESMSREGYCTNPYVYASVRQIAMAIAGIPWQAYKDSSKKVRYDSHPLLDLIHRPNPQQGQGRFFENLIAYLLLDGNSYILRAGTKNMPPDELYCLRPDRVKIIPGTVREPILSYVYRVASTEVVFDPNEVLHLKLFNPLNDWYGLSPLQAASHSVDQSNQSKAWNVSMLQNGARPAGALATDLNVDDVQYVRLREMIEEQHQGFLNAGRPLLLEGGMKWEEMGLTPSEMHWIEGQKLSAREIAMVYNIAPELIGDPESKTFSNYGEAREAFYEENILPTLDWIRDDLNWWFGPAYNGGVYIDYNRDEIEALQEDRTKVFARNDASFKAGWITINDARTAAGLDEDVDYGQFYRWQLPNFAPADPLAPPAQQTQAMLPAPGVSTTPGAAGDNATDNAPTDNNPDLDGATDGSGDLGVDAKWLSTIDFTLPFPPRRRTVVRLGDK